MIASPCVNICRMDERSGLCIGCLRTLGEIAAWSSASDDAKRRILEAIAERRQALPGAGCPAGERAWTIPPA